jgi:hypothetical protein
MRFRYVVALFGGAVIFGLVGSLSDHKPAATTPIGNQATTPAYCKNQAATYRLPECGLSQGEQTKIEGKERSEAEASYNYWSAKAHAMCDKPLSQMTMEDIEDCDRPGMRLLRER